MSARPFRIAKAAHDDGWAVRHWRGYIYVDTVRKLRRDAINAFIENYGADAWEERSPRIIHKAVRVQVLEITPVKGT